MKFRALYFALVIMALVTISGACGSSTQSDGEVAGEADLDTGRMSDGEYSLFSLQLGKVDTELDQYAEQLPLCGVLAQAYQLADASSCISEGYDGLEDDMLVAYSIAGDLRAEVAKQCARAVDLYRTRLNVFATWIENTTAAARTLQFDEFTALASRSENQFRRYRQARDWALADCEPR